LHEIKFNETRKKIEKKSDSLIYVIRYIMGYNEQKDFMRAVKQVA